MSPKSKTAVIVVVALLGIVLAAAVTWGTSQLVRQRIGLASEPLTAGQRLLPPSLTHTTRAPSPRGKARVKATTTVTTTVPVPVTPAPAPTTVTPAPAPEPAPTTTSAPARSAPSSRDESHRKGSDSTHSAGRDD